jgi:hypothetical protein
MNYIQNYEQLDLTGGELTVTYNTQTTDKISLTNEEISVTGFDNSQIGQNTLTIRYKEKEVKLNINIISKQIVKVEVTTLPDKKIYIQEKDNLDFSGGEITITYNDETTDVIPLEQEAIKVSGFDNGVLGKQTIIIDYKGHKTSFDIEIAKEPNPETGSFINKYTIVIISIIAITTYLYFQKYKKIHKI